MLIHLRICESVEVFLCGEVSVRCEPLLVILRLQLPIGREVEVGFKIVIICRSRKIEETIIEVLVFAV